MREKLIINGHPLIGRDFRLQQTVERMGTEHLVPKAFLEGFGARILVKRTSLNKLKLYVALFSQMGEDLCGHLG